MFLAPWFAIGGLIAAAGPVLIHLLNRRRYKVVPWAAMDFLREAIFRSRRIMQLRDLLLLALRTLAILLFGAALAQPFLGASVGLIDQDQPVHAVLLIDNSLSMGYQEFDQTLLERAKTTAKEKVIDKLRRGSRISVLPICGAAGGFSYAAYYTKDDALEALEAIKPVDRSAMPRETIDLALEACNLVPDMPNKRIYLLTDQQVGSWPMQSLEEHLRQLPGPIEVEVSMPQLVDNAWIADFKLRDGVADLQTPAVFVATIEYDGPAAQQGVQVELVVDRERVASQSVDLQPGQKREIEFPPYQFNVPVVPGKPTFVTAEVGLTAGRDGLPADDQRFLVVPVVRTLPVVFVDQFGEWKGPGDGEDPKHGLYGETFHLRRLLAPIAGRSEREKQLVRIQHKRIGQLDRSLLENARLVVVAGVMNPEPAVALLREYVEQGGNLVIAAGGNFDPAIWTQTAWNDGLGILPAPLTPVTTGRLPDESPGRAEWFQLDFNSLKDHPYFLIEASSTEELQDLYQLPHFFKTAEAVVNDEVITAAVSSAIEQMKQREEALVEIDRQLAELAEQESAEELSAADRSRRDDLARQRAEIKPSWLAWAEPIDFAENASAEELAAATKPTVLARYTNALPYMVQRRIGRGKVLLVTTGVYSGWNTLSLTNTVLVFDRVLRGMLRDTLPKRTVSSHERFTQPVMAAERSANYTLTDPDGEEESLKVDALGANRYGFTVGDLTERGHYRIAATRTKNSEGETLDARFWEIPLAVNGPAEESRLVAPEEADLRQQQGAAGSLAETQAFSIGNFQRAQLHGTDLWKWVMLAVMVCLLLELVILAWTSRRGERTA